MVRSKMVLWGIRKPPVLSKYYDQPGKNKIECCFIFQVVINIHEKKLNPLSSSTRYKTILLLPITHQVSAMALAQSLPVLVFLLLFLPSLPPGFSSAHPVQSAVVHSSQDIIQVRKRSYSCRGSCLRLRLLYPWLCYQYCYRYHIRMFRII